MLASIIVGTAMIFVTVIIESLFVSMAVAVLNRFGERLVKYHPLIRNTAVLSTLTLWLMAAISVGLWLWALLFYQLGEFESMETAIYFATVSATTLGYGDLLLSETWQLLSGFLAANGLVLFSLTTAFLFDVLRRIDDDELTANTRPQKTRGALQ
ncbi:MAG: ion channel [Pseudomonadota bacterium]